MKKAILILALLATALLIGAWSGRTLVGTGLEGFASRPPETAVARQALKTAEWFAPQSMGLLAPLILSLRVESVEKVEGSCTAMPSAGTDWEPVADYRSTVRAYTLFALPLRTYVVTCGGTSITVGKSSGPA